jgi:hypothetical protein
MAGVQRTSPAASMSTLQHPIEPLRTRRRIDAFADAPKEKHLKEALSLTPHARRVRQRVDAAYAVPGAPTLPARQHNGGENFSHPATLFASGFAQLRKLLPPSRRVDLAGYVHQRPSRPAPDKKKRPHQAAVSVPDGEDQLSSSSSVPA